MVALLQPKSTSGSLGMNIAILKKASSLDDPVSSDRVMAMSEADDPLVSKRWQEDRDIYSVVLMQSHQASLERCDNGLRPIAHAQLRQDIVNVKFDCSLSNGKP